MKKRKPRTKKERKAKSPKVKDVKAKPVKIMSDKLEKLQIAEETLTKLIAAKDEADAAELRAEMEKDHYDNAKAAAKAAKKAVSDIVEAYRNDRNRPLFNQQQTKTAPQPIDLSSIVLLTCKENPAEIPDGERLEKVLEVLPGGYAVEHGGQRKELANDEVQIVHGDDIVAKAREALAAAKDAKAAKPATSTEWKALPISELGLTESISEKILQAGYETLGKLVDLMQAEGQWWNKSIKGVGEESAAKVADAIAAFWAEHPEFCG